MPYLVKVLGAKTFGLVMFAQSFINYFNILVDYGFNLSATLDISKHRDDRSKLTEIFSCVMIIKALFIVVSFLILSIILFYFEKFRGDWRLYYLTFLIVIGQALFPVWYFQGIEKMKYITIVNVSSKLFFTIMIFVLVQSMDDYLYVPLLNGLGIIIGSIASLWIISKRLGQDFKLYSFDKLKSTFKNSSHFFLSRVSVSIYTSSNVFVLGLFTNNTIVGYYSVAEKLYSALQSALQPLNQALYPYIAKQRNTVLFKKIFKIALLFNFIGVIVLSVYGQSIFHILFGKTIGTESLKVFNILLIALLVVTPSILLGYPFLAALGFPKYANLSVVIGSIFHISGLFFLVLMNCISASYVALLVVLTETLVLSCRIYWSRKNIK